MTTRRELDRLTDPDDAFSESEIGDMQRQQAEDGEQQRRERAA